MMPSLETLKQARLKLLLRLGLRLGLLLALAPFLLLTAFNQPFFDDFRDAYWTRQHGMAGVQSWLYLTWTGRYTSTVFMTWLNPVTYGWLGGVKPITAGLFIVQWLSIAHLIRALFHSALRVACSRGTAFWAAGLLLALFCSAAPAPFSFLYWFCGAVAYQVPIIGLLNFTALALRVGWGRPARPWRTAAWACVWLVLALVGNELTLVQALPVLALLGYCLPATARPQLWLWLAVGGAATLAAVVAPGNWARVVAMAPPTDSLHTYRWLVLGPRAAYSLALFLIKPQILLSLLAAAGAGWWAGGWHRRTGGPVVSVNRRQWWGIIIAFGAMHFAGFLLFRYIIVGAPLMRAQNEILLVMLISTALLTWLAAQQADASLVGRFQWFRSGWLPTLLLTGVFLTGHVPEAWRELLTSAASFDAQMQARYAVLRAAHRDGQPTVTLPPLRLPYGRVLIPLRQFNNDIEFDIDLTPGCEGNINGVMERYFEVSDVCCEGRSE
ncbi:hypothetical protein ACFST9_23365 [Hymenobacter monticola]|uniref:Glycosyltransferase RgtA/B/C/D-like domain-containing protein n=1 Tax=Hymenobacter monticola TaxID=1705399 RepID=A0ABY4B4M0_9BACT|nr:hypothetical protein [Hymenobacter monticola]UOE33960.1 hypothetical protein MTP16_22955 [Hymenobacter monticola]